MSRCILHSTYLSLVQAPLEDHRALLLLFFPFIGGSSCFPPLRLKPFCPGPYQALIKTSQSFHSGFQSTRPSFKVAPHLFLEPAFFFSSFRARGGHPMASKRALGSFRLLLLRDSLPFLPLPLPSCDKLHSSHSRLFRSRLQLSHHPSSSLSLVLFLLGPESRPVLLSLCPPALLYRQQQVVEVRFQVFALFTVTVGGLPHFLRYFFRSCLLNFFCGQEPFNTV